MSFRASLLGRRATGFELHHERLYETHDAALEAWDRHMQRPGIVALWVSDEPIYAGAVECVAALYQVAGGGCIHVRVASHEPDLIPHFDVAWFDGVAPPDTIATRAKPGAVVMLSRQDEGSGAA
jgi:hypothetical protein